MMLLWALSGQRESVRCAVLFGEGLPMGRHLTQEHSVLPWKVMPALTAVESPVELYHYRGAVAVCCLVAQSCLTLCNPWTAALQASLSMGFPQQESWSGWPCPPPELTGYLCSIHLFFLLMFLFTLFYFTILYWFCHTLT